MLVSRQPRYQWLKVWQYIVSWEPEGHYHYSKMFCWEPEGHYRHRHCTVIAPFWFSTEHLWILIAPFWLSTADTLQHTLLISGLRVMDELKSPVKLSSYPTNKLIISELLTTMGEQGRFLLLCLSLPLIFMRLLFLLPKIIKRGHQFLSSAPAISRRWIMVNTRSKHKM